MCKINDFGRMDVMINLFTDFGLHGPYVGQMKSILKNHAPKSFVIDLMHDVPSFNSKAAAYMLAACSKYTPYDSIVIAVVDPGVGSERKGLVLKADHRWFIGPDNGLFDVVANLAASVRWFEIIYQSGNESPSFHGRDIFAPVAAKIFMEEYEKNFMTEVDPPIKQYNDSDLHEVIYIDHFGNLMTGIRAESLFTIDEIVFKDLALSRANTFSDVSKGKPFFYENSQELIEISVNCASAQVFFNANIGDVIHY